MQKHSKELNASLEQFDALFLTEKHAIVFVFELLNEEKQLRCRFCLSENVVQDEKQLRALRCKECRRATWFLVDTSFAYCRKLRVFCGVIWLMGQGFLLSAADIARIFRVAHSTATDMLKKVQTVVENSMSDLAERVDSSEFLALFCRRSTCTPANCHPRSEQAVVDAASKRDTTEAAMNTSPFLADLVDPDIAEKLSQVLSDTPTSFDNLCDITEIPPDMLSPALTLLELDGRVKRLIGDRYVIRFVESAKPPDWSEQAGLLTAAWIDKCLDVYQGISRKYLQKYLAGYWCFLDRQTWQFDSLIRAVVGHPPITRQEIVAYNSPPLIRIDGLSSFG